MVFYRRMITSFYREALSKKDWSKFTEQQIHSSFAIPKQHYNNKDAHIARLKTQCLKYQTQFSFIEEQIKKGGKPKRDNNRDHHYMTKETAKQIMAPNKSNYRQRELRRKELGITEKELKALREKKRAAESAMRGQLVESKMTFSVAIQ